MTRPVTVYEWWRHEDSTFDAPYERREKGVGNFHQFGLDGEWSNDGAITYTVAIVEMPDGHVVSVPVDLIRFDDV